MLSSVILALSCLSLAMADLPVGRTLAVPDLNLCNQRVIHEVGPNGKGYFFSWRDPSLKDVQQDWLSARNYCRRHCMETVSLETSVENEWIKERLVRDNVKYIWTSGRKCDFPGCNRADLVPNETHGWFWTGSLEKLAPTTQRDQNDWSENGGIGKPQPDNREAQQGGAQENCLAVLNQFYNDGVNWHDVACHHVKPWVCEENEELVKFSQYVH
ncbi:uncharacterized protein LOC115878763 [Sitophilus oryzae]|uniref:Uncharacterized protein LOC115878763 n=1 Tax=Sitophilus oryzae TaxID=7048 RepID=A0A6J2XKN7_SITOR|nr:uncharacterized protein LOC115878763 [Sitophilus oryzae]